MKRLIPIVLAVCCVPVFGSSPETSHVGSAMRTLGAEKAVRTADPTDLAKENADLKEYAAKLEARIAELEAKLKGINPPIVPKATPPNTFRFIPPTAPPRFPDSILPPGVPQVRPQPQVVPFTSPPQSVPDDWIKRQFNGQDMYLIPLK